MGKVFLDRDKCAGCGNCLGICPMRIFQGEAGSIPVLADYADEGCIACGHCVALCESGAITVDSITPQTCLANNPERLPDFESFAELVRYRRSIRRFQKKPVEQSLLDQLFEILRWAPTAKNRLPLKWIVVNNPQKIRELAEIIIDEFRHDPKSELIVDAWDQNCYDWIFRGAPCLIFAYTETKNDWTSYDTTIGAEIIDLAAPLLGLGTCWAGFFIRSAGKYSSLRKALGLAPENEVGGALMIGYPEDEIYRRNPPRPDSSVRYI